MFLDEVVGHIIQHYLKQNAGSKTMSRQKLPCTRCRTVFSSTWRPGPCGTSSLCNVCGVKYMQRNGKPRMIDLVIDESKAVWMERNTASLEWQESHAADISDRRVEGWVVHEKERIQYVNSKKRKFVHF